MNQTESTPQRPGANALRQLAAAFYDGLLLLAILFLASALTVPLTTRGIIAIDSPLISLYFFVVCFLFFGWFWTHGGRTLGMRIWHIKLLRRDGTPVGWAQAFARFLTALPAWGLFLFSVVHLYVPAEYQFALFTGWLQGWHEILLFLFSLAWVIVDHWKNSWRDRVTRTRLVLTK